MVCMSFTVCLQRPTHNPHSLQVAHCSATSLWCTRQTPCYVVTATLDRTSPHHPTDCVVVPTSLCHGPHDGHHAASLLDDAMATMLPSHTVASHWHSVWPRLCTPLYLITLGHHADADPPSSHSPYRSATLPWHPNLVQPCAAMTHHTLFTLCYSLLTDVLCSL